MSEAPVESWREEVLVWSYSLRRRWRWSGGCRVGREEVLGCCLRCRHVGSEVAACPE